MPDWAIVGLLLGATLLLLAGETWAVGRARRAIPVRVVVTGTRGKSSVTRLIAFGLRAGGVRVLYKTTGSAAVIGLPDGAERPIRRHALPTPLEQRGVLRLAKRSGASAVVCEAMSVHPESLRVELVRILDPHVVAVTNVRADHIADLSSPDEAFANAVPEKADVFYPSSISPGFIDAVRCRGLSGHAVNEEPNAELPLLAYREWPENLALAIAVCRHLGVDTQVAARGMTKGRPDIGALAAWRLEIGEADWIAVNGFAANDPESTGAALAVAWAGWGSPHAKRVGLLNLRRDRGDRTAQWIESLRHDATMFDRLVAIGDVPRVSVRPLRRAYGARFHVLRQQSPERLLAELTRLEPAGGFLFGFGNIGGVGMDLVRHWSDSGDRA